MPLFDIPTRLSNAWPAGARDFDFLQDEWIISHSRLTERLVGSTQWLEFETPFVMHPILGGLGNIDQCRTTAGAFYEGISLRLFDLATGTWHIYWIDSNGARLCPPVVGAFNGPLGSFHGEDTHQGRPVLVTFQWNYEDASRPVWQQAFSADGGNSWETNWHMHFRRADGTAAASTSDLCGRAL